MKVTHAGRQITVDVTSDGEGLVSHAGSALLAQVADKSGLSRALSSELDGLQLRAGSHDRGRVIRDLAVMLADGGDCLADVGALSDQAILFGDVASSSTAFRVIDQIASDPAALEQMRAAHARARARVWKLSGAPQRLTIDLDATLIGCHSEKEGAAGTFKGGFGFHPMLAYADHTPAPPSCASKRPGPGPANSPPPFSASKHCQHPADPAAGRLRPPATDSGHAAPRSLRQNGHPTPPALPPDHADGQHDHRPRLHTSANTKTRPTADSSRDS